MIITVLDDNNNVVYNKSFKLEDIIKIVWNLLEHFGIIVNDMEVRLPTKGNWLGISGTNK